MVGAQSPTNLVRSDDEHLAGDGARQLHRSEARRAARIHVPQRSWCAAERQLCGLEWRNDVGSSVRGASQTITVNLVEPGTLSEIASTSSISAAKNLRFGGTCRNVGVDVINLLNANPCADLQRGVLDDDDHAASQLVLQPRLVKFSAQFNF